MHELDLNKRFEQIGISIAERIKGVATYMDGLRESLRVEILERKSDSARLTDKTNKLDSELAQERTIRSTADNSHDAQIKNINTSLSQEISDRVAKDNDHDDRLKNLRQDLTDEHNARTVSEANINKRIDDTNDNLGQEIANRTKKNTEHENSLSKLNSALNKEVSDRTNDVKALNTRAANIEKNLSQEVTDRKTAVEAEKNRSEGAYPKKNGAGANGKWNISISGRADIATEADHAKRASEADHATKATNDNNGRDIVTTYAVQGTKIVGGNTNWNTLTDICQYKIQGCTMTAAYNAPVDEYPYGILVVDGIRDALDPEHRINQVYYPHNPKISPVWVRMRNGTDWTPWKSMSTKQYVTEYAPSKSGSGANGKWNISISGNADNATHAVRTDYPQGFNGKTNNATWGKGNTIGSFVTGWSGPQGSDIAFRNNNGQMNVVIDGQYYANEGNSLVLHEGNWNNYAPSRTGGGASGKWDIDISRSALSSSYITPWDKVEYGVNRLQYFNMTSTSRGTATTNGTPINDWAHIIRMNHGNKGGYYVDLAAGLNTNGLWYRRITNGTMSGWHTVLDSLNWNNYAPSKTGGGASGTWGISITGNSHTVDGYHENSFLRYRDATATAGAGSLWNQIGIRQYNNALPDGMPNTYKYGAVASLPGADSRLDIWYNHQSSANNDGLWYRTGWTNDKKRWARLLDSYNFNIFAPTLTGGGASGTWNIGISGTAANATKWSGLLNDTSTENNSDTWIPVLNSGKLQHTTKANMKVGGASVADDARKLSFSTRGNCNIRPGDNDNANGPGGALNNLVIDSWYGVSFTTSCSGQTYSNKTAVSINCRNGDLRAPNIYGRLHGTADAANSVAWGNVTGKPATYPPSGHNHDSAYPSTTGARASGTWNINVSGTAAKTVNGGAGTSWVTGRDVAILKVTGNTGDYRPTISSKTQNGSWEYGMYTGNIAHFSYISDDNYNKKNNQQTADIQLKPNGEIQANSFRGTLYGRADVATNADNSTKWNGMILQSGTENNDATWIPVFVNNTLQHTTKANMNVGRAGTLNYAGLRSCANGKTAQGITMTGVYNNGYPTAFGNVINVEGGGGGQLLLGWAGDTNGIARIYYRNRRDCVDTWSGWKTLAWTDDKPAYAGRADTCGTADTTKNAPWANVSGKPAQATRWPSWGEVTGKPSTFAPSAHNHDSAYPSTTGARASGTWNININGNANTATTATKDNAGRIIKDYYAAKATVDALTRTVNDLANRLAKLEKWKKDELFDSQGHLCFPNGNKLWIG